MLIWENFGKQVLKFYLAHPDFHTFIQSLLRLSPKVTLSLKMLTLSSNVFSSRDRASLSSVMIYPNTNFLFGHEHTCDRHVSRVVMPAHIFDTFLSSWSTDQRIDRSKDWQVKRSTDQHNDRDQQIDRSTDRQIDRLTDQQIDRSKDLKIEGSKDRQTKSPFSNNLNKFCYKCLHTVFSLLEKVLSVSTKFVYFRLQNNNNSFNF
jgi:hypothetical protein